MLYVVSHLQNLGGFLEVVEQCPSHHAVINVVIYIYLYHSVDEYIILFFLWLL